jgi:tetratricopeptide (TPR) repeat protein
VAQRQGRYDDAVERQRRALAIFRDLGAVSDAGRSLDNLGVAYHALGRYDDAVRCLGEALAIAEQVGERYLRAECLRDLGTACHAQGDTERARYHWEQSRKVFAELGVPAADEVADLLRTLD